jgi:hypothetical protein
VAEDQGQPGRVGAKVSECGAMTNVGPNLEVSGAGARGQMKAAGPGALWARRGWRCAGGDVVRSDLKAAVGPDPELGKVVGHGLAGSGHEVPVGPGRMVILAAHVETGQGPAVYFGEATRALVLSVPGGAAEVAGVGGGVGERGRGPYNGPGSRDREGCVAVATRAGTSRVGSGWGWRTGGRWGDTGRRSPAEWNRVLPGEVEWMCAQPVDQAEAELDVRDGQCRSGDGRRVGGGGLEQ